MTAPMGLPFAGAEVPHVLLDILRGCNMTCRACYNSGPPRLKERAEVLAEFELARRLRRLDCVTLLGGEPLLHPELDEILRDLHRHGVRIALFSNAFGLDLERARRLRAAGAELLVAHIEKGQNRPDLAGDGADALQALRQTKLRILAEAGLEGGISVTVLPGEAAEAADAVETALTAPQLSFCLITLAVDPEALPPLQGDIFCGLQATAAVDPTAEAVHAAIREQLLEQVLDLMQKRLGAPFAVHPSIRGDLRWYAHLVATVHAADGRVHEFPLRPTWVEAAFNRIMRRFRGRHFFYQPPRSRLRVLHLLLNGLAGGGFRRSLRILRLAVGRGARLAVKRILLQVPANLDKNGQLVFCRDCPDAVVRHGTLVPVCIADRVLS